MKNKFDILYESIMDELNKSKVDYQLNNDFKKQVIDELNHLKLNDTDEGIKSYLKLIYTEKVKRGYPLYKDDRLEALNDACKEVLNKELGELIELK